MHVLHEGCRRVIECLELEQLLAPGWNVAEAADMLSGMMSIPLWEHLTIERGWSQSQYITRMQAVLKQTFVKP